MTDSRNVVDFLGEDGCLRCGVCGKRKQLRINFMGKDHVVGCLCDCEVQARKDKEEQLRREKPRGNFTRENLWDLETGGSGNGGLKMITGRMIRCSLQGSMQKTGRR